MRPLIVLRAGDAAAPVAVRRGEFFSWIARELADVWRGPLREHDLRDGSLPLPRPEDAAGFVITGSSSSVTERAPWMLRAEAFVRQLDGEQVPLFGICFGHQLIAEALGGKVTRNPRGREIGTVTVRVRAGARDPLLAGLPDSFSANATHVDTAAVLPARATLLAATDLEPHAIFSHGPTTKAVQFHPEIDGDAMRGYVEARSELMRAEGLDPEATARRVADAPHGAETLRNFARHVIPG